MSDPLFTDRVVAAIGDRYDIVREIGRGGMSVVFQATDVRLNRSVAIKVLPPELAFRGDVRTRFLREAQTAARLSHPNIVPIYSVDEREGMVYFAMGLVEGESLAQHLATTPRPPQELVIRVLRDVADALGYAHSHGVVHRDIKPDNILIERETGRVMVTDFGIARAAEGDDRLTVTGVAVGTPSYMSPEQAMGEREVDGRSDCYSLGIVGYQMVTGELPFRATSTPAMLMKHVSEALPPVQSRRHDASPELAAILERALAKKPDDRWPGAKEMRDAVVAFSRDARGTGHAGAAGTYAPPRASPSAPPVVPVPAPPRGVAEVPELPPFPAFPSSGGRGAREDWRDATRRWRDQVRAQQVQYYETQRAMREAGREVYGLGPTGTGLNRPLFESNLPLEQRIDKFRGNAIAYGSVMPMLLFINVAQGSFPWVIFPALGWGSSVLGQAMSLRRRGVSPFDALLGRTSQEIEARDKELAAGGESAIGRRVAAFKRAIYSAGFFAFTGAVSTAIGAGAHVKIMALPALISAAGFGLMALVSVNRGIGLRRFGVKLADAWYGTWRQALNRDNPQIAGQLLQAEMLRLVPPDVLAGPYGDAVRAAATDRAAIMETVSKLGPADRELIPDVIPTVQGLEERVVMLAGSLHRMAGDVSAPQLTQLEQRIAKLEAEGGTGVEKERTLGLLKRQRETLADLVERRETLQSQLESASLLLQTIKLDLLRLRSAGVQSAIRDVSTATQEARALSKDIGTALDVAAEVRAI